MQIESIDKFLYVSSKIIFPKVCYDCNVKLGYFVIKHKVLINSEAVTVCTRCKDLRSNGKKYCRQENSKFEKVEQKQENEHKLNEEEILKVINTLLEDELIQNYSKKYIHLSLTLSSFLEESFKEFRIYKESGSLDLSILTTEYNKLINSLNSLTIDGLRKLSDVDLESLNRVEYSVAYDDYTHIPKGYDFIKSDFLKFYKNEGIDSLFKISQWVFKKYSNIKTEVFYKAINQLACENIKLEISNKIEELGSKENYYTYFIDNNPNIFDNNHRYWYYKTLKLNTEVLYEMDLLKENNVVLFIEELKEWKLGMELETFERHLTKKDFKSTSINEVDLMTGIEFEHFVGSLLKKMGYNAKVTKASGDQGADLIANKNNQMTVIQAKCYSGSVSNKAVQEVAASIKHYNADGGMVITNSTFTRSAIELADSNNIRLVDRNRLIELMVRYEI